MALLCKETGLTVLGVCAFYWLATRLLPLLSRRSRDCHQVSPTALFLPIGAIGSSVSRLVERTASLELVVCLPSQQPLIEFSLVLN